MPELHEPEGDVVFRYDPDSDGGSSALFFNLKFGASPKIKALTFAPLGHGRPDQRRKSIEKYLYPGSEQWFYDTAPGTEPQHDSELGFMVYRGMWDPKKAVRFIGINEHHVTSLKVLDFRGEYPPGFEPPEMEFIVRPDMPSAAHMAWTRFFPDREIHPLIPYIDKVESGNLETHDEEVVAAFVDSFNFRSPELLPNLATLYDMPLNQIRKRGEPILAVHYGRLKELKASPDKFSHAVFDFGPGIRNRIVRVVEARLPDYGRPIEKLLRKMALDSPDGISCAWFRKHTDSSMKLCIRSVGKIPAVKIAEYMAERGSTFGVTGGGHHDRAAVEFQDDRIFRHFVQLRATEEQARDLIPALHYSI